MQETYGSNKNPINIDSIDSPGYFYHVSEGPGFSGTSPSSILGTQDYILIGMDSVHNGGLFYGSQIAFSFVFNIIVMRICPYSQQALGTWGDWTNFIN